jgi:hypothetical protein
MAMSKRKHTRSGCLDCDWFDNDPESLESVFRNLRIMCSAYASVRGDSGLCNYSDLFRLPRTACEHYKPKRGII